jgi:hypothetical protein
MFIGYSVGQIITPNFFLASESPRYPTGFRAVYVSVALMIVIEIVMMSVSRRIYQALFADSIIVFISILKIVDEIASLLPPYRALK